jgi:hypothetical protein
MSQIVLYTTLLAFKQCSTLRLELTKGVIHWYFPMLRLPTSIGIPWHMQQSGCHCVPSHQEVYPSISTSSSPSDS